MNWDPFANAPHPGIQHKADVTESDNETEKSSER